jgi:drug/metabolite transporter (DMT)-like permease
VAPQLVCCFVGGALFSSITFLSINSTFYFCGKADLNPGIAQTIWGFTPFLSSILDFFIYKTTLQTHHIVGIFCIVLAAAFISLSDLVTNKNI